MAILRDILHELEQGKELSMHMLEKIILVLSQLEDVRDIAFAEDDARRPKS